MKKDTLSDQWQQYIRDRVTINEQSCWNWS